MSELSIGVYHHASNELLVNRAHFDRLRKYSHQIGPFSYHYTVDRLLESNDTVKVATYHVPFPSNDTWVNVAKELHSKVAHSFIFCSELHKITFEQIQQLDLENVSIFVCGFINAQFKHAKVYQWLDWFDTSVPFYRDVRPNLLPNRLKQDNKQKYFDILLGCQRPHREHVFNYIHKNTLTKDVLMTYHRTWSKDLRKTEYIMEKAGVTLTGELHHTIDQIKYYGFTMSISQVVPINIYNQTHYSLVAETNAVNDFNFYTEKIVKPILAGRLFIVIAGQYYLKNLRSLGFKTFDGIIDESYDEEANDTTRWDMALDQLRILCSMDPDAIRSQINDIVTHNQKVMLETNWYDQFHNKLIEVTRLALQIRN